MRALSSHKQQACIALREKQGSAEPFRTDNRSNLFLVGTGVSTVESSGVPNILPYVAGEFVLCGLSVRTERYPKTWM